jgi:acyl-CoA synthetase (AMP-forming)/AMP-acid ligase II
VINVSDIVRVRARELGAQPALIAGRDSLDWTTFDLRVDAFAAHLRLRGLQRGDIVGLSIRGLIAYVVAAMAVARIGATYCGIDARQRPAETAAVLEAIGARAVLTDHALAGVRDVLTLDAAWQRLPPGCAPPPRLDPGVAPLSLTLSSGTTGRPKAIAISHQAALWRAVMRVNDLGLERGMRGLLPLPLAGSAAASGLLAQLLVGAVSILHPPLFTSAELVEALRVHRIAHVAVVPTMVRGLLELAKGPDLLLPELKALVTLGAAFHVEEKQAALARITPHIYEHYGATGAGPIARALPAELAAQPDSVGRPHSFVHIDIVDEAGKVLPAASIGRIRVASPGMASGYHGDTGREERNELFGDGWMFPGDLGRLDADGQLYLEGRASSLIIRGGLNLYPEEIESVLQAHPLVVEAAVAARPDARLGEVPVALVVGRAGLDADALAGHCRGRLAPHKVPVEFRMVEALPKTANGKLRRADLPAMVG